MERFQDEIRRLAQTTSMKGVARAMKSNFLPIKLLWAVSVCVFVGMAVFQAGIILVEYIDYPAVSNVEVERINLVNAPSSIQMPHLTVCNLNPLSSRAYTTENYTISIDNFMSDLVELLRDASQLEDVDPKEFTQLLYDFRRYYAHVGPELALVAGHQEEEFLVVCKVLVLQGLDMDERDCGELANVTQLQHPRHLNCYTVAMADQTPEDLTVGYSVTLHLANYNSRWYRSLAEKKRYEMGAVVVLHQPGTYPNFHQNGYHVAPGTHVNLRYNLEHQHRLEPPHGPCASEERFREFLQDEGSNLPYKYTKDLCISSNIGWYVAQECNCTEHSLADILQYFVNSSICGMHGKPVRQRIEEIKCATLYGGHQMTAYFASKCPIPCHELHYRTEISQSLWPPDPLSPHFYEAMIANRHFEAHYTAVAEAIKEEEEGVNLGARQHHLAVDLIRHNFVNIDVYLGQLAVFHVKDSPKLSLTSLMSMLGGILNLWAGITVVLAVEFVEFLLRLIFVPLCARTPQVEVERTKDKVQLPVAQTESSDDKPAAV